MKRRYCFNWFVLSVICMFFACAVCAGDIVYVDDDASSGGDGRSWGNAYNYLQDGLASAGAGDEIHVAQGVYKPDHGQGITIGDKMVSFLFTDSISVYGGYAGINADNPDYRDVENYKTVLSGDLTDNDVNFVNNYDNSFHVIDTDIGTKTVTLDGLTICSGNTPVSCLEEGGAAIYLRRYTILDVNGCVFEDNMGPQGAAIYASDNIVNLTNCTFTDNEAVEGGAICVDEDVELEFNNCLFKKNSANDGAVLYVTGQNCDVVGANSVFVENTAFDFGGVIAITKYYNDLNFTDCNFVKNTAQIEGGVVYSDGDEDSWLIFAGCMFDENSANDSGGVIRNIYSNLSLSGCDFNDNSTDDDNGGAICSTSAYSRTITDCNFQNNSGNQGSGAIYCKFGSIDIDNCTFVGNSSDDDAGAISISGVTLNADRCLFKDNATNGSGGAIHSYDSDSKLTGCIFIGNSSVENGGAIEEASSQGLSLINCVFNGNNSSTANGGAIFGLTDSQETQTILTNCVFYNNSSHHGAGGVVLEYFDLRNSILWANSRAGEVNQYTQFWNSFPLDEGTISNCCIQGWDGEFSGVATIADDPLFVDVNGVDGIAGTEDDNFRLSFQSPCIDAGASELLSPGTLTDIDGFKRVLFGNVDIGPCEYNIMSVDDDAPDDPAPNDKNGSDPNECGSPAHPFDTIEEAMDVVEEGYTIEVLPGSYPDAVVDARNDIDFSNKNITLRSADPNDWNVVNSTIINAEVYFGGSEDPNCRLLGFKICNKNYGFIYGRYTHATISNCNISGNAPCNRPVLWNFDGLINNCLISDNDFSCSEGPVIWGCNGVIRNCTIANNAYGVTLNSATIENSIIYNNNDQGTQISISDGDTVEISYSNIQGGLEGITGDGDVNWGAGNIDVDPCFVGLGQWDMNAFELDEGDYHLQSFGWRVDEENPFTWLYDPVTSRCIDAGNPGCSLKNELMTAPNDPENDYAVNIRINMGAYGGTSQASLAPYDWAFLADLNNDGVVDFKDISLVAEAWLSQQHQNPGDLDRNGAINMKDYALLGQIWQKSTDWAQQK